MELNIQRVAEFIGGPKNRDWENGFLAGQKGDDCPAGASESFQDGYGRGYAAAEMSAQSYEWLKKRGLTK
jgi:hypothetical protein